MNKTFYLLGLGLLLISRLLFAQEVGLATTAQPATSDSSIQTPSMNRSIVELLNKIDQLQKEIRQLRGDLEVVNHELAGIKHRQRELYLDMDRRLRNIELVGVKKPDTTANLPIKKNATKAGQQTNQATGTKSSTPTRAEKDSYNSAWNLLKEGRYDRSIKSFAGFLVKFPQSSLAGNAQYWLGEANYVSRKYKRAVKEFSQVISAYPDSLKLPDAMLKLGFTYYELRKWGKAREMLEGVMQNYPKSSAARLAGIRLKRLQNEGH